MNGPTRCPLCGSVNDCGIAAGNSTCWCFSTKVPPEVLARVPDDERGRSCVCRRCAETAAEAAVEAADEVDGAAKGTGVE